MSPTPVWRPTARILLTDPDGRVLLFSSGDREGGIWWFTPGGAVRRGETLTAAAVRELAEETGYMCAEADLGTVVATCSGLWPADHDGAKVYFAADSFFFLRVPRTEVVTDGQEDYERDVITGHRWWTVADLRAAGRISPAGLGDLIAGLLRDGAPARPVRLPWTPDLP